MGWVFAHIPYKSRNLVSFIQFEMNDIDIESVKREIASGSDPKKLLELALKQAEYDPEGMRKDIRMLDPTCVDTTKAIDLKLGDATFKPLVAYPIYAADYIRGYKNPRLLIEFDEITLLPYVKFQAEAKIKEDAPDAVELLSKFMPEDTVYGNREEWDALRATERKNFKLGDIPPAFHIDGYSVRLLKFTSDEQKKFLQRLFVFCWFFIEGARAPDDFDPTWEVYVMTQSTTQRFVAYTSVYSFFYYLNGAHFEAEAADKKPVRKRVAHFLVTPPYQGQGLGKQLYLELLKNFVADSSVYEVEVEEPSSGFEVLRDRAHYSWLSSHPIAQPLLDDFVKEPKDCLEKLVKYFKMDNVQFERVAEMKLYMDSNQKETRALKKLIKSRLWHRNYEDLRDMDPASQRIQLQHAYENVLHTHRVVLHLEEEPSEEESGDESDSNLPTNPADILLAQLAQGMTPGLSSLPPEKKRRTEE